jgi:phage-related protein
MLSGTHRDAKALSGFGGAGVVEVVRTSAATRVHAALCGRSLCIACLPEESKTGAETPRRDRELIKQRLREAEEIARETMR